MRKSFISKQELAAAYFPNIDIVSARHKLISLIKDDAELLTLLLRAGYNPRGHYFSPLHLDLIFNRLGNPFT